MILESILNLVMQLAHLPRPNLLSTSACLSSGAKDDRCSRLSDRQSAEERACTSARTNLAGSTGEEEEKAAAALAAASVAEASAAPAREDWGAVEDWGLTNCLSDPLTNCASRFTSMISQLQQPVGFCNSSFRYI